MAVAPYSQPYIEYINILKPHLAYLKLNIHNKVSFEAYFLFIAGNVPDRSIFWKKCPIDQLSDKCAYNPLLEGTGPML